MKEKSDHVTPGWMREYDQEARQEFQIDSATGVFGAIMAGLMFLYFVVRMFF